MNKAYFEMIILIERLHRRFLDIVRIELNKLGIRDINAPQALVLANIGESEILVRDLVERGYYLGQNVNYSIRKLVEYGYLNQERDEHDKRAVRVSLTEKGKELIPLVRGIDHLNHVSVLDSPIKEDEVDAICATLRKVERCWSEYIQFRPYD